MASKTATAVKAALALAATDINTALEDDTVAGQMANEWRVSNHPIRDLNKLFILNKSTGQFTSNDAYIDIIYGGNIPVRPNETDIELQKI